MSLPCQHTELPTKIITKACKDFKSSGNILSVFITIARNILQFPEGRKTLRKMLSLRYIGEQLNMKYQNVWKAVRKLATKGYIKIVELGRDGIGSIIELVIFDDTNTQKEEVIKSITPEESLENTGKEEILIKAITPPEEQVIEAINTLSENVNKSYYKDNNPPYLRTNEEPAPVVCSQKSKVEDRPVTRGGEFTSIASILPAVIPVPEVSSPETSSLLNDKVNNLIARPEVNTRQQEVSEEVRRAQAILEQKRQAGKQANCSNVAGRAAETTVIIPGITPVVLTSGIQFLRDRNITDINQALSDIKSQMDTQDNIKNKKSYFLHLCKEKKNFSKAVEQKKAGRLELEQKRREEEFRQIEKQRENEDIEATFEDLAKQYPEEIKAVVTDVNSKPGIRFVSGLTKLLMYVNEFRLRFNT